MLFLESRLTKQSFGAKCVPKLKLGNEDRWAAPRSARRRVNRRARQGRGVFEQAQDGLGEVPSSARAKTEFRHEGKSAIRPVIYQLFSEPDRRVPPL